jgi:ABC-type multidrug transport system ATPase subunit
MLALSLFSFVSTQVMLVGPAKALFMDEISCGLDSSTTYQIVKSLHQSVHVLDGTMVVSFLQPVPETYALLDDLILLSEGVIVYRGLCNLALEVFESMGVHQRKGLLTPCNS